MSSAGEHTEASSSEAELERVMDDERLSPRSEVVVASADTATRPVPARASVMAAAEALLEYASVGRTDNDRESAQWSSSGQTETIKLGDCGRLQQHRVDGYNNIISYNTKTLFKSILIMVNLISLPVMLMSSLVLHAKTKNSF